MFEYKIQQAWDRYKSDFGLGRIVLFICFFNSFLFFISGIAFGQFQLLALIPIVLSLIFYFFRSKIVKSSNNWKLFFNSIPLAITVILNYYLVGEIDRSAGTLNLYDSYLAGFDYWLFKGTPATKIYTLFSDQSIFRTLYYDLIMTSYLTYFPLPFVTGIIYYQSLDQKMKFKIGRFFTSIVVFYSINYLFYLFVPVAGPQFFLKDTFDYPLPLSQYGQFLFNLVKNGQTTFIDCFPSGHTGIALLCTSWSIKMKFKYRIFYYFLSLLIICATITLRYHYILDLLAAIPLTAFSYKMGKLMFYESIEKNKN